MTRNAPYFRRTDLATCDRVAVDGRDAGLRTCVVDMQVRGRIPDELVPLACKAVAERLDVQNEGAGR